MNTKQLHNEWAHRPADQRFLSVAELHAFNVTKRDASKERGVALDHLRLQAQPTGALALVDPTKAGQGAALTHWSFGQLCNVAKAPAGYLRSLPAELAQIPLQYSLEHRREDAKLLLRNGTETWRIDAITSDSYGRIWDADLSGAIIENLDLNRWKVPVASYATHDPKRASTLYASDRDCFLCLVDDQNPIEVPGTNGIETLYRGLIARNSEVGCATLEILAFLYRTICDNRTIWGGREIVSLKVRHTSGGPMRYLREAKPAIERYLTASPAESIELVQKASAYEIGKTEKDTAAWLQARGFTKTEVKQAQALAEPNANPRALWSLVNGLTAAAHDCPFGDERLDLERRASKLLDLAL